ncbi:outer membrane receptor protein involved in Fe transport [Novosphingobium sp. SG751A]|uniref:TonB-dependent receptor domain-containing protein n=1 Tax=Novosphingobium sp. SG751A TaxID=2587000 RepID=UPI001557577C|nr:TonB-dependent receptor [Novosphingobium sp. SG751A]NOW44929.1 outer membrane receptor protein involved in Fe transport [Novosphingobium sp. SG751A]
MALFSSPAWAQVEKQAEEPAKAETAPDIVVTGTRLANGFQAPTPVTVLTGENLIAVAPTNVASALAQLPSLATSQLTTTTDPGSQAGGTNGSSLLNLRNLGVTRNLVLLNGRRVVSTNAANSVDIATLPQNLIQRVDIVTGGASAAYGSDAVAGVVNFVLDTKFTGLKGDIGGGISTYGDLGNFKGSLAWGRAFLDNRLHIIASAQYAKEYGVAVNESSGRDWFDDPVGLIPNTLSSSPSNLIVPSIRSSVGSDGGLITNTILRGTQFLVGGVPAPFNRGFNPGAGFQSGGDGSQVHYNFAPDQRRNSEFVHAEYDVSDDVSLFAEGRFAYNFVNSKNQIAFETGSGNQFTIYSGNPFIPASIQTIMAANNIPSFTMGRYLNDYPIVNFTTKTLTDQETIGFKGKNLFGGRWAWNASFARGHTFQDQIQHNLPLAPNIYAAADAVVNPQTGQIVCRSQFYNAAGVFVPGGTGLSSGCKPINFFGNGSVDPSAIGYTIGDSSKEFHLTTYVAQASVSGDLGSTFQLGAGPISIAAGVEYREESAYQTTDALSPTRIDATGIRGVPAALNNKLGPYRFFNPLPFSGSFNVKEAFVELGVPILKDKSFARSLAFDVAARHTDYSQTGGVTTWKVGADWQVIDDIRLRGSVSRDIRAPNILELFNAATQFTTTSIYPSSAGGVTTPTLNVIAGNPDLQPEKALTQAYGVVLTPTFAPGLSFSADYYNIKIKGAIASLTIQQTLDNCAAGQTIYCSQINFANGVATVATPGLNLNVLATSGIDFEAGYRTNLFGNPLSLRVLATRLLSNYTTPPNSTKISTLGGDVAPHWRVTAQLAYDTETWKVFVQQRYIGPALMDATKVEGVYTDENDIPAVFYTDATLSYKLKKLGLDAELYLTVNNIFNREPPIDIAPPSSFSIPNARNNYDRIGRMYNAGLRFNF